MRFRRWAALHAVGAAGERRVWSNINGMKLFPNIFTFLVGPPGAGKSAAINPISEILRRANVCNIAPTDMSKQGLLDTLIGYGKGALTPTGDPFDYHFMCICISELSNFMSQYDTALAGLLTDIFDCPPIMEEKKRGQVGDPKIIPFPGLSFIMGTATQNLGVTIDDAMWGSGFMARVVLVYSDEIIRPVSAQAMFSVPVKREEEAEGLIAHFREIGNLTGEMAWTLEAQHSLWDFWTSNRNPPMHNRLANYCTRRWMHLAKLMMISALSEVRMEVTQKDFLNAQSWLMDVEHDMPEIFKDMVSHEDGKIYEEITMHVFNRFSITKITTPKENLVAFLSPKVSSHALPRLLEIAEQGGYIARVAGTSGDEAEFVPGKSWLTGKNLGLI